MDSHEFNFFYLLFLENPQITLASIPALNPATFLPILSSSDTSHSCPEAEEILSSSWPGLLDQPLIKIPIHSICWQKISYRQIKNYQEAYAVITSTKTVEVTHLLMGNSSQKVKLITLTGALYIA